MNTRTLTPIVFIVAALLLPAGCSTIAVDPASYAGDTGPPVTLRLCLLKDEGISCKQAEAIIAAVTREMALWDIAVTVPWIREWRRPGFFNSAITRDVAAHPLEAPCDRILALVGRGFKDFAWGMLMPEILGAVESLTHTKGYAVARLGSLNQLLSLHSPADAAIHEIYHMLGCDHGTSAQSCAAQIARLKTQMEQNRADGKDFLPGIDTAGNPLWTRAAVEAAFEGYGLQTAAAGTAPVTASCALPDQLATF
jgi:hypothetical protein